MNSVTVAIPTYYRENLLLKTLQQILLLEKPASEILVIDQTPTHEINTTLVLTQMETQNQIVWIRLPYPSIPRAMNEALIRAQNDIVLFLDDDVTLSPELVAAHAEAHLEPGVSVVVGQIIQPWETPLAVGAEAYREGKIDDADAFQFNTSERYWIRRVMGGNLSVSKERIVALGGFDENFIHVAYRFEAEFAERLLAANERILFEPRAGLFHLKEGRGGTRTYGHHLTAIRPSHAVGEYYYLLQSKQVPHRWQKLLRRPVRSVQTKHHLRHPWWIPLTLLSELWGFAWALALAMSGPKLIRVKN